MVMELNASDAGRRSDPDQDPDPGSSVEVQLIYSITVPLSSAIVLANLLLILAISCTRRLHSTPHYLFLSLLVADLGTGVALPLVPWMGLSRPLHFPTCLLVHVLPNFLFLAFLLNLVLVHWERYRSIVSPLRHRALWWGHRRVPLVLLALWLPPLLFALLPAFGWNNHRTRHSTGVGRTGPGCCRSPLAYSGDGDGDSYGDPWSERGGDGGSGGGGMYIGADPNCSLGGGVVGGVSGGVSIGERCCSYRHVFPNAYIYLEVYGILAPAILSIAAMTGRVLWITHGQLRDIRRLQRSVAGGRGQGRGQGGSGVGGRRARRAGVDLRYARCVAAVSLTFLACWVPYIIYTHVGVAFLLRPGARGNATAHIVLSCAGIGGMAVLPLVLGLANREYTDPIRKLLRRTHTPWTQRTWDAESIAL